MNIVFDPIEEVLEEIRQGHLVIVTDDANRENEGDLDPGGRESNAGIDQFHDSLHVGRDLRSDGRQGSGPIGIAANDLRNTESMRTAYTISVDAKDGVTTGISAADRARTIRLLGGTGHGTSRSGPSRSCLPTPVQGWRRAPTCRAH